MEGLHDQKGLYIRAGGCARTHDRFGSHLGEGGDIGAVSSGIALFLVSDKSALIVLRYGAGLVFVKKKSKCRIHDASRILGGDVIAFERDRFSPLRFDGLLQFEGVVQAGSG